MSEAPGAVIRQIRLNYPRASGPEVHVMPKHHISSKILGVAAALGTTFGDPPWIRQHNEKKKSLQRNSAPLWQT
jgi:hypothetical protein